MAALPFPQTARLYERPETQLMDVPFAVWPASGRPAPAGMHFDHEGEAPIAFAAALEVANRFLRTDSGEEYVVVTATPHWYLPHVALRLRRSFGAQN